MSTRDVIIVGGGVIGLSIAYALARGGASVCVLDAGQPGQASSAAAGMLAPLAEATGPGPFVQIALESLRRWPTFVQQIRSESETSLDILGPGMLRVARTEAEERALCASLEWQGSLGLPLHRLDGAGVRSLEPAAAADLAGAILSPEERHVEPRILLHALTAACQQHGVQIRSDSAVTGFEAAGARLTAVRTAEGLVAGGEVVIARGAWVGAMSEMLTFRLPVYPLRGQVVALGPLSPPPFHHTLYAHGGYLVPRPDGRVVAGATEERVGFDAGTTETAAASLRRMAASLSPAMAGAAQHSLWAGLRPVSADGLPLLGRLPGWDNVHVAAGHGRNGILLTPITGDWMAAHLLQGASLPLAFAPSRFLECPPCPSS